MTEPVRVLLVEDSPTDAELVLRELRRAGLVPEWMRVETEPDFLAQLDRGWQIILADYDLPQFSGLRAVELLKQSGLDIPIIIVSGTVGEATAVEAMKAGANDYAMKDRLARLGPAIQRELRDARERHRRKLADEALIASEVRYRRLFESAKDGILILDAETGAVADVNPFLVELLGFPRETFLGKKGWELGFLKDIVANQDNFAELQRKAYVRYDDMPLEASDGRLIDVEFVSNVYLVNHDKVVQCNIRDITERKRAERALRVSEQKFRAYVEHAPDGVFVMDTAGFYQDVNVAACRLLGYAREALLRMHASQIVPAGSVEEVRTAIEELQRDGRYSGEFTFVRSDGSLFVGLLSATRVSEDRYLGFVKDITERKRAEESLRRALRQTEFILNAAGEGIYGLDVEGRMTFVNPMARLLLGYDEEELLGQAQHAVMHRTRPGGTPGPLEACSICAAFEEGGSRRVSHEVFWRKDGTNFPVEYTSTPVMDGHHRATGAVVVFRDITERLQAEDKKASLEAQLNQAQKMESMGRLAGGVAHDFNNMLGVIIGHAELAMDAVDPLLSVRADLEEIHKAASRSADLTRQLLAFARKQTIAPVVLDLNEAVRSMIGMLRRVIGEDIELLWRPGANPWRIKVDPSQIDQILANLCVNARDAIVGVGKVIIETGTTTLDDAFCSLHQGSVPGQYVRLSVSDDGCGMDAETRSHLFEPFFTTKAMGRGTGLGLATVYGIVKQNRGFISADSEPNRGTTFTTYLPRHVGLAVEARPESAARPAVRGHETILLAEDEPAILALTKRMLENLGYTVLAAGTPRDAVRLAREYPGEIHLLMTDVVMPEMNGRVLAANLLSVYPVVKRLFMSGYTADVIAHQGVLDEGLHFIQKPFSMDSLAAKVREALDAPE